MKVAVSALVSAIIAVSGASNAVAAEQFKDFTVDEASVPGAAVNVFVADKLNGGFTEYVTFTGPNTFSAQARANIGQFFKDEGQNLVPSQLNNFGVAGYGMYALFEATGTFAGLNFTGGTGAFYLYIDPLQDTTFGTSDGIVPVSRLGTADDYLIASSTTLVSGTGTLATAPGAYNFDFEDVVLTSGDQTAFFAGVQDGESYFIQPRPFHILVQVNGDNDASTGSGLPGDPIVVTGDVSAVFKDVPEPTSVALVGLALLGAGVASRRRKG